MEDTISLNEVLGTPVKVADQQPIFAPDTTQTVEPAPAEFEDDPEPPTAQVVGNEPGSSYENAPGPESLSPDDLSIIFVNMLDGFQKFGFAFARKKMAFSDKELELLGRIDPGADSLYEAGSKEAILQAKYRKHLEAIKALPFEPDEKKRLIDATMIYARTTQIKVSPFTGLLLAYSEVIGTRALTVFSDL